MLHNEELSVAQNWYKLAVALLGTLALGAAPAPAKPSADAVIRAKFAAVNRHAIDAIVGSYAPDAVLSASDFCAPRQGRAEVERTYRAIFAAVPDIRADVLEMLRDGDRVAVRVMLRSRRPGAAFDLPLMNFFTVRRGLIVRDDGTFDNRGRACKR